MTVAELIALLKKKPQDLQVIYSLYSEHTVLKPEEVAVEEHCLPRADGWVEYKRPDKPCQKYIVFPGN